MAVCVPDSYRLRIWLASALCAALASGVAHSVCAQPATSPSAGSEPEPAGYRTLVADALSEYEASHFEEARALMQRAHQLLPSARTLRGLGMISFELREYARSVRQLEAALASSTRPLDDKLRAETLSLLARARGFTGRLALAVEPEGARVFLDGMELAPEAARDILLTIGEHVLEVRSRGYVAERRTLRVAGGRDTRLRISLAVLGTASRDTASAQRAWYLNPWLWISAGALVAAGTATAIVLSDDPQRAQPYSGLSGEPPLTGP